MGARLLAALLLAAPAAFAAAGNLPDPRKPQALVLRGSGAPVEALAESPQGGLAACGDADGTLGLYDLGREALLWKVNHAHQGGFRALAFDKSGETLYSLGRDGVVKAWDAARGGKALAQSGVVDAAGGLWWSPDGRFLYVALGSGALQPLRRQDLGGSRVLGLASSAPCDAVLALKDGHFLASQDDGLLSYVSPDFGVVRTVRLTAGALALEPIAMEGTQRYVAAALKDGNVVFLDLKDLGIKKTDELSTAGPAFAFLTHDVRRALLVGVDGSLDGFRLPAGTAEAHGDALPASAACMVDGGNSILLGGGDGGLRVFRHPAVQAAFVRILDQADQSAAAGRFDLALFQYTSALQVFQDPAVRASLQKTRDARQEDLRKQRDQMKALSGFSAGSSGQ